MASNGVYGINIPVTVDTSDIEIFYSYSPYRNSDSVERADFTQLNSDLLEQVKLPSSINGIDQVLEGVYNLKLPLQYFSRKGVYNVYIRPKEIPVVLLDVGVLTAYPDVRGLIVDITQISDSTLQSKFETNNGLVGYRIIYFDDSGQRLPYYRLVTSNNKCEPVVQNLTNVNQKAVRYRYNDTSTLSFITVTPSVGSTFRPNATPFIGKPVQKVCFVNTLFEPVLLELEMVDHDIDTVSTMLEGSQLRDLDNSLITTFNQDGEIYNQQEFYTLKNSYTNQPIYEVRKNKSASIDFTQTIDDK